METSMKSMHVKIYHLLKSANIHHVFEDGKELKFRFCEEQSILTDNSIRHYVMCEFESKGTFTMENIQHFVTSVLNPRIGIRLFCKQVIQTTSHRYLLMLTHVTTPNARRRFNKTKKPVSSGYESSASDAPQIFYNSALNKEHTALHKCEEKEKEKEHLNIKDDSEVYDSSKLQKFNGSLHPVSFIKASTSTQTENYDVPQHGRNVQEDADIESVTTKIIPMASITEASSTISVDKVNTAISNQIQLSRMTNDKVLQLIRQYLAFYSKHETFGYKNETAASCKVRLSIEGLPTDPDSLLLLYIKFMAHHGIKEAEARRDIENLGHMILCERTIYLQRAREASSKYFSSPIEASKRIRVAAHGYNNAPGRCDPELCIIQ